MSGWVLLVIAFPLAAVAGCWMADLAFKGNWGNRPKHECGFVATFSLQPEVCDRCGEANDRWVWQVCRWRPWGWEVKR